MHGNGRSLAVREADDEQKQLEPRLRKPARTQNQTFQTNDLCGDGILSCPRSPRCRQAETNRDEAVQSKFF